MRNYRLYLFIALFTFLIGSYFAVEAADRVELKPIAPRQRPILGAHFNFADGPHEMLLQMRKPKRQDLLAQALRDAGIEDLRMSFHGYYSHMGPEATEQVKKENKLPNEYPWFPIEDYISFIKKYHFTTVLGINVEEGADVAEDLLKRFEKEGALDLITSVEFGNEPFLSARPWQPEEYAEKCAEIIERIRPFKVKMGIALVVGKGKTTVKISGNEYGERTIKRFSQLVDLRKSDDIYGIVHLYSRGVKPETIEQFNQIVRKYSSMKYQVTEYNIRLWMGENPHLTKEYAMEFARKLNRLMVVPEITGFWIHSFPYHSLAYWTNGKYATVVHQDDPKLKGDDWNPGWHLTPAGKVHQFYQKWAWNGEIVSFMDKDDEQYWAVNSPTDGIVVSVLNDRLKPIDRELIFQGKKIRLSVDAKSMASFRLEDGKQLGSLSLK
ncbi:MAG: hypothetical protein JNN15_11330 [Blastocatellia bacterium]|nr:hypothetical protein [Blastocatellia bacterium]